MNQEIEAMICEFRNDPSEDAMHSLIEMGKDGLPAIMKASQSEEDVTLRNRLFEVLSEMPCEELIPWFQQELLSRDQDEVRFAVLALFRNNALRFKAELLKAIEAHPNLSKDDQFVAYMKSGFEAAEKRLRDR